MIEPEEAVSLLGGTESEEGMVRHELTCLVEARALRLFVHVMEQPPVYTTLFKYLDFKDISNLRQAILHCHATTGLRGILLYDGLMRVIPYPVSLVGKIEPILAEVDNWRITNDTEKSSYKSIQRSAFQPSMGRELKIIHLISYCRTRNKVTRPLSEEQIMGAADPKHSNFCLMSGELDDNTVFYLSFRNSPLEIKRGFVLFAPTYKGLVHRLARLNKYLLEDFADCLNSSQELSNLIQEASAEKASTLLGSLMELTPSPS